MYVGQADNADGRWIDHQKHASNPLYQRMAKHGVDKFTMKVVEEHESSKEARIAERDRIRSYAGSERELLNRQKRKITRRKRARKMTLPGRPTWNGVVYWAPTKRCWMAKLAFADGKWRNKCMPADILETQEELAIKWLKDWLTTVQCS